MAVQGEMNPAVKEYLDRRVANIKTQVTVADVLSHYGIDVRTVDREFQYPCPLHGDGQDNSYSARMYPDNDNGSGGTYCFACHKSRDCIRWVQDKEALSFGKALSYVERTFHVSNIPKAHFSYDPDKAEPPPSLDKPSPAMEQLQEEQLKGAIEAVEASLRRAIAARHNELDMAQVLKLFYTLDTAVFGWQEGELTHEQTKMLVGKIWSVARTL